MGIRIFLANSISEESSSIQCEVESDEKVDGLIETAVGYWELDKSVDYSVKCGVSLLTPGNTIASSNIKEGDRLVIVDPDKWLANLDKVKRWIGDNLGGTAEELQLLQSEEEGSRLTRYVLQNSNMIDRKYEIIFDNGMVKSYRPM